MASIKIVFIIKIWDDTYNIDTNVGFGLWKTCKNSKIMFLEEFLQQQVHHLWWSGTVGNIWYEVQTSATNSSNQALIVGIAAAPDSHRSSTAVTGRHCSVSNYQQSQTPEIVRNNGLRQTNDENEVRWTWLQPFRASSMELTSISSSDYNWYCLNVT